MNYQKRILDIKANLTASKTSLNILRKELQVLESSPEENTEKIAIQRKKVRQMVELVKFEKIALKKVDFELSKIAEELEDDELKVFRFHYIKGYNLKKVAKKLYFSYGNVKKINTRIREKLGIKE